MLRIFASICISEINIYKTTMCYLHFVIVSDTANLVSAVGEFPSFWYFGKVKMA